MKNVSLDIGSNV